MHAFVDCLYKTNIIPSNIYVPIQLLNLCHLKILILSAKQSLHYPLINNTLIKHNKRHFKPLNHYLTINKFMNKIKNILKL